MDLAYRHMAYSWH